MKILVTNDDGIYAKGLWDLAQELKQIGEVLVIAPDREQSGVGTSITVSQPVRINKIKPPIAGVESYAVEGTPADSVIFALRLLSKDSVDLVMSGINEGENLGNDILISGTVSAALQGYFNGLPSIAISVAIPTTEGQFYTEAAAKLAGVLGKLACQGELPQKLLLNVNLPNLPLKQIQGIEVTRLGQRSYYEEIKEDDKWKRGYYRILRHNPAENEQSGTDIWAVRRGKISLTSLHSDLTSPHSPPIEELCQALSAGLRILT